MHNIQTLFWKTRQTQPRWFNDWTISSCNAVSESIISESVSISSSCSPFSVSVGFAERVPLAFGSAQSCERQPAPGPPPTVRNTAEEYHSHVKCVVYIRGVTRRLSHETRHLSHETRHLSHETRHLSHETRHLSHETRHLSHETRHETEFTRQDF